MGISIQQWRATCGMFCSKLVSRGWTATSRGGYNSRRWEKRYQKEERSAHAEFDKYKTNLWILFTILISIIDMGELINALLVCSQLSAILIRWIASRNWTTLIACWSLVFAINLLNNNQIRDSRFNLSIPAGSTLHTSVQMPPRVWYNTGETIAEQLINILLMIGGIEPNPGPPVTPQQVSSSPSGQTALPVDETECFSAEEISQSQDDPTYSPDTEMDSSGNCGSSPEPDDMATEYLKAPKAIVVMPCLLQLFTVCRFAGCGSAVDPANVKITPHGAAIVVNYVCNNHHQGSWCSSPTVGEGKGKVWVLNVVLATYILTCGLHVSQILEYFQHLRIYIFGKIFFYNLQKTFLERVVWLTWSDCQKTEVQNMKSRHAAGNGIKLAGDGKFDSRGFSASYCTYNLMDLDSGKVVGLWVAQKDMVNSSTEMEPYAAKTLLLNMAWVHKVPIDSITTDRSTSMKSMLGNLVNDLPPEYVAPKHYFDIWHWIKSVLKDLWAAAKLVSCKGLGDWVSSINNMMWHSFSSCKGDPDLLKEKLMSIPKHVANEHNFPSNEKYLCCPHPPLVGDRTKAWLHPDSLAVKKIRTALTGNDGSRLNDISYMTGFTHTGPIENWNSLHNKYANKNYYYSYSGMLTRGALAGLDHNFNCNRVQAKTEDGVPKFDLVKNRFGNKWFARRVLETKDGSWRDDITYLVLKLIEAGRRPKIDLPVGSEDFLVRKSAPRPSKEEAIKHQQSRMIMS